MFMIRKFLLLTFIIVLSIQTRVVSQASLVPVYHNVYDWLHYQRVLGNVPFYNYEALPLTRGQIEKLISSIDEEKLNKRNLNLLRAYKQEFSTEDLKKYKSNSGFSGSDKIYIRATNLLFSDEEPHLYVWDDKNSTVAFDYFWGSYGVFLQEGNENFSAPYYRSSGIRTYGTLYKYWGFHYEQWRAVQAGDNEPFTYLPFFSRNAKFQRPNFRDPNKSHLEAFAGFQKNYWSLHIGRGTLKYGVGQSNNLIFSREGVPFDWVRFNINTKHIKFTSLYGSLSWEIPRSERHIELEGYPGEYTRVAPSRTLIHQRIQFQPAHWISFGFYELQIMSNRDVEIGFLNPVTRLSLAEWEYYDQGNGFVGFEGVIRPFHGMEIFGEILVDDLGDTKDLVRWYKKEKEISNLAVYLGANYALKTGTVLRASYQRLDPNIYTHKFILNSHVEKGFSLGSQVGPNGDQMLFGIEQWLSHRTRIKFDYTYNRHGLNEIDESGNIIKDVGGSLLESYTVDPETLRPIWQNIFLDGDLHRWNNFSTSLTYEPWRGVSFNMQYRYTKMLQGDRLENVSLFNVGFTLGY